jgi:hypothetical protein
VVVSLKKIEVVYRCRVCVQGRGMTNVAENMGDGRERGLGILCVWETS